jgi:hypothetical protein
VAKCQITDTNVVVKNDEIYIDLNDSSDFNYSYNDIVPPIEPKIKYGYEVGNPVTRIILQNSNVNTELNELAMVEITFDSMNSLYVEDIKLRSLQLKETIKDSLILDYDIYTNNMENEEIDFYRKYLGTIIKDLKFWIDDNERHYSLYFSKRNVFYFRVKVVSCK